MFRPQAPLGKQGSSPGLLKQVTPSWFWGLDPLCGLFPPSGYCGSVLREADQHLLSLCPVGSVDSQCFHRAPLLLLT